MIKKCGVESLLSLAFHYQHRIAPTREVVQHQHHPERWKDRIYSRASRFIDFLRATTMMMMNVVLMELYMTDAATRPDSRKIETYN